MGKQYSTKVQDQIAKAGLPQVGAEPFEPKLVKNVNGEHEIQKKAVQYGRKQNKKGYVDTQGRIWVRDWAHSGFPDHWDVQVDDGQSYFKVDDNGTRI